MSWIGSKGSWITMKHQTTSFQVFRIKKRRQMATKRPKHYLTVSIVSDNQLRINLSEDPKLGKQVFCRIQKIIAILQRKIMRFPLLKMFDNETRKIKDLSENQKKTIIYVIMLTTTIDSMVGSKKNKTRIFAAPGDIKSDDCDNRLMHNPRHGVCSNTKKRNIPWRRAYFRKDLEWRV